MRTGDSLQTIAQAAYGDSQLWYLIADVNGLGGNSDLRVGQTVSIPTKVGRIYNTAGTYKPYDLRKKCRSNTGSGSSTLATAATSFCTALTAAPPICWRCGISLRQGTELGH